MATHNRQSQFYRRISLLFLIALTTPLFAGDIDPSGYQLFKGDRFFLLSDATFGTNEEPKVRLEAPGREENLKGYGGVDVVLYRISDPLAFLKAQKNLHRPVTKVQYEGEGLKNALGYLWDSWYKKSRLAWQRILSSLARSRATAQAPELKQTPAHTYQTKFDNNPQFAAIPGMPVVERFRYPLWEAKPTEPPKGAHLEGSSSNFVNARPGNIYLPLGKQKAGLYLVEAFIGNFRASTLVFVSDTIAITKLAGPQTLVWTVDKASGLAKPGCKLLLTDGVGTLSSGVTDGSGVWINSGKSVEHTYVLGTDPAGGVFVSENFYYDSEVYDAKVYLFTDRPLYHPGDTVFVKVLGRRFKNANFSTPLELSTARLDVIDSTGNPVVSRTLAVGGNEGGGSSSFVLPTNAPGGGYSLKLNWHEGKYGASFRVAEFIKPHFEIEIGLEKKSIKTNEPIRGRIQLTYPSGKPVTDAKVSLEVRAQKLSMVSGEVEYLGSFPVQLLKTKEAVASDGTVPFELPPATDPSRYILKVGAVDGASFRVSSSKEILIQAGHSIYSLATERRFSRANDEVNFTFKTELSSAEDKPNLPVSWEAIRLEDRKILNGMIPTGDSKFSIRFEQSGSYTVTIKDATGSILGSTSHWVEGAELKARPGSIQMVADKEAYEPGEVANILITFSEKVNEALATIERDSVEQYGSLTGGANWLQLEKKSDTQWVARVPVRGSFAPNATFSLAYVLGGKFVFENKGLNVVVAKVQISMKAQKAVYLPGEKVVVDVTTSVKDRPVAAKLAIGVVDEMIYVLQPEIAPDIADFFYHRRRNQVRTTASLAFHAFDAATSAVGQSAAPSTRYDDRPLKLRERPRRDETDTALWLPDLSTGANGKAQFSFVMPDSLTRWRITARALTANGIVGQHKEFLVSNKDYYLKWSGPQTFREGDRPKISLIAFNTKTNPEKVSFEAEGLGENRQESVTLNPGSNFLELPLDLKQSGVVHTSLQGAQGTLDDLQTKVKMVSASWPGVHSQRVPFTVPSSSLLIPKEAEQARLTLSRNLTDRFLEAVDSLVEYPYGCVEQTSSRLIPLIFAYELIKEKPMSDGLRQRIETRILNERFRLIQMAGPDAKFGWWGNQAGSSAFFTAYAYYADWLASRVLGISLPTKHWEHLLDVYAKTSQVEPPLRRAVVLWLAEQMGLSTKTLTEGAINQLELIAPRDRQPLKGGASEIMEGTGEGLDADMATVLVNLIAQKNGTVISESFKKLSTSALEHLQRPGGPPLAQAILLNLTSPVAPDAVSAVLAKVQGSEPTVDRALTLIFLEKALKFEPESRPAELELTKDWKREVSAIGRPSWKYVGKTPAKIEVSLQANSPAANQVELQYESFEPRESRVGVTFTRELYELSSSSKALQFKASLVKPSGDGTWNLHSASLYVDEVTVTPPADRPLRFGLLEIPLPAGASLESTTWGMEIDGLEGAKGFQPMDEAKSHPGSRNYSVALEVLDKPVTFRHLVRFPQVGQFVMPPIRYFRMYLPSEEAFQGGRSDLLTKVVVER